MADAPLVTVIVRSLDRGYLREALASVLTQTWSNIEVVVVAARPGHAPLPELDSFPAFSGQRELRLLDTDQPRLRSHAANVGLDAARGQYLIFLDDDDWLMPGHIERLVQTLQAHAESLAAYTGVALVDADRQPLGQVFDLPFDAVRQLAGNITPIHAVLFDARLLQRGCRFDETLDRYEDWDFWIQLARQTVFIHLPGVSALYRIHQSSGVHEDPEAEGQSSARIYDKWQAIWGPEQIGPLMRRVMSHGILQAQLAAAEQGSAEARKVSDQAVAQIASVKHHVDALRAPLDGVQQLLVQQHAVLHQLGQDDALRVEHLGRQVEGHAASLNQQIAQLQAQVQAAQSMAEVQGQELAGVVARQQAQAAQQTDALQFLSQVQTDTAGRWAMLDQQLAQQGANHTQAATAVAGLASSVGQLSATLGQLEVRAARQDALLELQQQLQLQMGQLQQMQQQGAQREAELQRQLGEQRSALTALDRHLAEQAQAAQQLSTTLAEVSAALSQQTARAGELSHQIHALQSSTSWRITKPLRVVVDALSRPFRGRPS